MSGELGQGVLNEFKDQNDASDPLATLGRFLGAGSDLDLMSAAVEVVGDIGGGVSGLGPDVAPAPTPLAPNANAIPGRPMPPGTNMSLSPQISGMPS